MYSVEIHSPFLLRASCFAIGKFFGPQEIQNLNREIERLENASEEEIVELKSEISSLKSQIYQAKKDVRDKEKIISSLEKQLVESEEQVEKLRCRIRTISSRKNSPERRTLYITKYVAFNKKIF
jgi:predicted RNase H-like nuclease (RuvC/YqgF family)